MKKALSILAIILGSLNSNAQSFGLEINHYTILVRDIEKSGKFYNNILRFKEKETPWALVYSTVLHKLQTGQSLI